MEQMMATVFSQAQNEQWTRYGKLLADLRKIAEEGGDPTEDLGRWHEFTKLAPSHVPQKLIDRAAKVKKERERAELIAECTADLRDHEGPAVLQHRTNLLLAAILEKLYAGD